MKQKYKNYFVWQFLVKTLDELVPPKNVKVSNMKKENKCKVTVILTINAPAIMKVQEVIFVCGQNTFLGS